MHKLTLEEYGLLDKDVRTALRRKAFGHPRALPPQLEGRFDLEHLRAILVQENDATGWFPAPWDPEEDEAESVSEVR